MCLRLIFSIFFLFLVGNAFAQPGYREPIPQDTLIEQKGRITQMTIRYRGTAQKQVLRFRNGLQHGLQESYNEQGTLIAQARYKNGFLQGEQVLYNSAGQVMMVSRYKYRKDDNRSTLEGEQKAYRGTVLHSTTTYKDSLKNGVFTIYDHDGKIQQRGNYENGLLSGRVTAYYANGKPQAVSTYVPFTEADGRKRSELHGEWTSYTQTGSMAEQGSYEKGAKTGIWRRWENSNGPTEGRLVAENEYRNGKQHGIFRKYAVDGKLQSSGILYEEIEVDGTVLRHVYDGALTDYYADGTVHSAYEYKMGKPHGTWLYYYENGTLQSERRFEEGMETGTSVYFDREGSKILEIGFAIVEKDGVKTSVKHGPETAWTDKVLVSQTTYNNGKQHGSAVAFFPDGKPQMAATFNDGNLEGEYLRYHDNGNLNYRQAFVIRKQYDGSLKSEQAGWQETFDREGRLLSRKYHGPKETILASAGYSDGVPLAFAAGNRLEAAYFPDGKLMSVKVLGTGTTPLAFYFYRSGRIRKIQYEDLSTLSPVMAEYNDTGDLLLAYEPRGEKKAVKSDAGAYAKAVGKNWAMSPLFTDDGKNGRYTLNYASGKPFLDIGFNDNLPHGDFTAYEPLRGDTVCYAGFRDGLPHGKFVEKFAGRRIVAKGRYHDNGEMESIDHYKPDGKAWFSHTYNTLGQETEDVQYHSNGRLQSRHNHTLGTSAEYDENGLLQYEHALVPGKEGWKVNRQYYPGTKQLKRETFYAAAGEQGTDIGYYPNGKIDFKMYVRDGKRTGPYVRYDKQGQLLTEGQYVDGEMHGEWMNYADGKQDADYYDMGKRRTGPPKKACGCADTSIANSDIKFAPTLKTLASLKSVLPYLPPYLIPDEEFNYGSIFYVGLQISNGHDGGFASMKLLPYDPIAFYLPADKQVKITLNPCAVKGYISNMEMTSNYSFNDEKQSFTTLYPKRIMLELPGSPLKSADPDYKDFTMLFDVKAVSLNAWKFDINEAKDANACYSTSIIKGFLKIEIEDAMPWLFQSPPGVYRYSEGNGMALTSRGERYDALDNFFGVRINKALVSFPFTAKGGTLTVNARATDIYAGGKLVTGSITIPLMAGSTTDVFRYTDGSALLEFTADDIKRQWAIKGFTRLDTIYKEDSTALELTFYAE